MDIHPSYSILLGRSWIHFAGVVTSSLHQYLKYIMNRKLVTIKVEEIISMIRNVVVPFIEKEDCNDKNIYAFKIVNIKCVPENMVLRRPKISEETRMAVKCFLRHGIFFSI
jgi:hypothetical protein